MSAALSHQEILSLSLHKTLAVSESNPDSIPRRVFLQGKMMDFIGQGQYIPGSICLRVLSSVTGSDVYPHLC